MSRGRERSQALLVADSSSSDFMKCGDAPQSRGPTAQEAVAYIKGLNRPTPSGLPRTRMTDDGLEHREGFSRLEPLLRRVCDAGTRGHRRWPARRVQSFRPSRRQNSGTASPLRCCGWIDRGVSDRRARRLTVLCNESGRSRASAAFRFEGPSWSGRSPLRHLCPDRTLAICRINRLRPPRAWPASSTAFVLATRHRLAVRLRDSYSQRFD